MDTYSSGALAAADRAKQQTMLAALGAWERALRRDDCNAWTIQGCSGTIFSWSSDPAEQAWLLYITPGSTRGWSNAKSRMGFCRVTQDGDDEGCLKLDHLPTPSEAEVIRHYLGLRKRREDNEATLRALQERIKPFHFDKVAPQVNPLQIAEERHERLPPSFHTGDPLQPLYRVQPATAWRHPA